MGRLRIPRDPNALRKTVDKLLAAAELEQDVTLSPEEAGRLWQHVHDERYRHQRTGRLPIGNPYE